MKNILVFLFAAVAISATTHTTISPAPPETCPAKLPPQADTKLKIIAPADNKKVHGIVKVYGTAASGSDLEIKLTSVYYKMIRDGKGHASQGDGPVKRMNRKFKVKTSAAGRWAIADMELRNGYNWNETFTITATSVKYRNSVSVTVMDETRAGLID